MCEDTGKDRCWSCSVGSCDRPPAESWSCPAPVGAKGGESEPYLSGLWENLLFFSLNDNLTTVLSLSVHMGFQSVWFLLMKVFPVC